MYLVYTILGLLFLLVHAGYHALRHRRFVGNLGHRLGYLPVSFNLDGEESIWIHAVSVGEVLTARALVSDLRARYPRLRIFVSTTTMTGQEAARRSVHDVDEVFYFPFDLQMVVNRTLRLVRPRLFLMMETEIWPNLLRACRQRGVKTLLANGRISSRSYPRYRLVRPFMRQVLADIDRFCMQSEKSARLIVDLGADPSRVTVTGNLKFDSLEIPHSARVHDRVLRFFRLSSGRPVVIAASTMRGEEGPVLAAFRRVRATAPEALLILAPRHPERFEEVEGLARTEAFRVVRRSALAPDAEPRADVVILDSFGELARLYQIATVVFVGGSLVDTGGHNILEPAVYGKPIVIGPYMQNFAEIAQLFVASGAAWQVRSARELGDAVGALLEDPVRRAQMGAAARTLVETSRGAKERTLETISELLPPAGGRTAVVRPFRVVQ